METTLLTVRVKDATRYPDLEDVFTDPYELFVLKGNNDYFCHTKASWYKRAKKLYENIANDVDLGFDDYDPEYHKCDEESWKIFYEMIKNEELSDSDEGILFMLQYLYPDYKFGYGTIRGYSQSEWQNVIYRSDLIENLDELEAFYFGKVYQIDEDICGTCAWVSHSEFWRAEMHTGGVEELVKKKLEIENGIDIEVLIKEETDKKWRLVS